MALAIASQALGNTANNSIPIYQNPSHSAKDRAADLLSRMTWVQKIGQMGGVRRLLGSDMSFNQTSYEILAEYQNGILGFGENYNLASDVLPIANMVREEQIHSTPLGIPYITVTDSVNSIYNLGGTLFPPSLSLAASFNLPLYKLAVGVIRDENVAVGTRWVLSPELDLAKEPHGGRVGEMFGEDKYLVGEFGTAYVNTMQQLDSNGYVKVACTVKHFVFGQSSGGINAASQYGGINHIMNEQAVPFIKVVRNANPYSLMASYSAVDRVPMAANKFLLQTVLRNTIGFNGVIMSDAGAISELHSLHLVSNSAEDAAVKALKAGLGLELSPGQPAMFPNLVTMANDSTIVSLVNDAVQRLLEIKFVTGTFDEPLPTMENLKSTLRNETHLDIARKASEEAIVLLKNDGTLPLSPPTTNSSRIAVLGPLAELLVMGSYAPNNSTEPLHGKPFLQSLQDFIGADNVDYFQGVDITDISDSSGISAAVSVARQAGLAIVCLGSVSVLAEDGAANWRTDGEFFAHPSLGFPGLQQDVLDAVLDTGVPTLLIMTGGQGFVLQNSTVNRASAILHSFLAGESTGEALVDILYGSVNPSGKLPITLPPDSGSTPIYYDYLPSDVGSYWSLPVLDRANPPFKFGYGLSYTTFDFSTAEVRITSDNTNVSVLASVTVSNTGSVLGKEVAQLYFRQQYTAIETPNKQLIRFTKIELAPGEKTMINWTIASDELGYWQNLEWVVDSGNFTFWIGSSSRDEDLESITIAV
ncbi:glycoside hydrolase superfamily [Coniella lustricola]|uniref:beta-glucosidase n=1 Tax=Coniella lustricola TaxID=2025994 RepID=A0A2T3A3H3_9PEZI|nr:glycoside hydrolase superfamily [Coniella lustricola]